MWLSDDFPLLSAFLKLLLLMEARGSLSFSAVFLTEMLSAEAEIFQLRVRCKSPFPLAGRRGG